MKKRICFLVDSIFTVGGVQRVTAVIAKELSKEYDVTIITLDKPTIHDPQMYGLAESNLRFIHFEYPALSKLESDIYRIISGVYLKLLPKSAWTANIYAHSSFPSKLRRALLRELQAGKYDAIIGVHAPLAARLGCLSKYLRGTRLIGWIHNSFEALFGDTSLYIGPARQRYYVYQFRKLDNVVLLCHHDAESYAKYDPVFRTTVIYNPLTLQPGRTAEGNSRRFLAIGRFARQHKGFDLLIEAFHLFAQKNKEWVLDLVGEGVEEELYRSLIQKYQLADRVVIHPFTNNIQEHYSNAQVYVLSSRWEGFGLVLVEAMAHGLPIVSSNLPTSLEIMGDFGLYFQNGHVEELARRLEDATQLDWQLKSAEALNIAKRFDVEQIVEQWKQLIER